MYTFLDAFGLGAIAFTQITKIEYSSFETVSDNVVTITPYRIAFMTTIIRLIHQFGIKKLWHFRRFLSFFFFRGISSSRRGTSFFKSILFPKKGPLQNIQTIAPWLLKTNSLEGKKNFQKIITLCYRQSNYEDTSTEFTDLALGEENSNFHFV